jgi:hypothetical protein
VISLRENTTDFITDVCHEDRDIIVDNASHIDETGNKCTGEGEQRATAVRITTTTNVATV